MDTRARVLITALSLILLVSLTMACSLPGLPSGGGTTPTEEETPEVSAPPEEQPPASEQVCGDGVCEGPETQETCPQDCGEPEGQTPPSPEEELPFDMSMDALSNLDSYAYTLHMEGLSTMAGGAEQVVLDIEGKRQAAPTKAQHLKFSSTSDGDVTEMEFIYIEDQGKLWVREGGESWQEMPVMDESMLQMFDTFSMMYWWDTLFVGDPEDAQYLGQEVVNGVPAHHYSSSGSTSWGAALSGCTFASAADDIWVAVDGRFPVKRQLNVEATCGGEAGKLIFLMEVSDVNQPLNITPPM
jgi:hypothetical protein